MKRFILTFLILASSVIAKDAVVISSDGDSVVLKGVNPYQLNSLEMGTKNTGYDTTDMVRDQSIQSLNDTDRYPPHPERRCPMKVTFYKCNELSSIVLPGYSDHKYGWTLLTLTSDATLFISIFQYYSHYAQANQSIPEAQAYYQQRLSEDRVYLISSAITSIGIRLLYNLF